MLERIGNHIAPWRVLVWALVLGVAIAVIRATTTMDGARSWMAAFDVATMLFLLSVAPLLRRTDPAAMRDHARANDANRPLLLAIATLTSLTVMLAVWSELNAATRPAPALIVGTLILAWLFGNMMYALHYAHLYYREGSTGGLTFAGDTPPDFVYFAFTLGMTFQTSDTSVDTRAFRAIVTLHSMMAFVFNLGVVAFTINTLGARG